MIAGYKKNMKNYDAVVIGTEVSGTSVTYHLAEKGLKVALVEKGDITSGASGRCDGNVLIADKQQDFDTEMTYKSQLLLKELVTYY